ncbi:hypothetical protein, partial [Corynebacterium sp.]|uniref:hypothetical protein n=1 Tax=Corynebacterium sp. TaxID=1720 RepID=UPI0026DF9849
TRDPHLGKVMRYQLRYIRTAPCGARQNFIRNGVQNTNRLLVPQIPGSVRASNYDHVIRGACRRVDLRIRCNPGAVCKVS